MGRWGGAGRPTFFTMLCEVPGGKCLKLLHQTLALRLAALMHESSTIYHNGKSPGREAPETDPFLRSSFLERVFLHQRGERRERKTPYVLWGEHMLSKME